MAVKSRRTEITCACSDAVRQQDPVADYDELLLVEQAAWGDGDQKVELVWKISSDIEYSPLQERQGHQ
jgi:hypothetical protein